MGFVNVNKCEDNCEDKCEDKIEDKIEDKCIYNNPNDMSNACRLKLKLEPVPSILDGIECEEVIHNDKLDLLINSSLLQKDPFLKFENEKAQLIKYRGLKGKVKYNRPYSFGRTYVTYSAGLQSIRQEARHTLTNNLYVDIDTVNCHPVIMSQVMQQNGLSCKYLRKYVKDRDNIIKYVEIAFKVTRDQAKELLITMLYGGRIKNWMYNNKVSSEILEILKDDKIIAALINFEKEVIEVQKLILDNKDDVKKELQNKKKQDNIKDTTVTS
jgi:hypothetical protein